MSAAQLQAATIYKQDNMDNMNSASSWIGGVLPTTSDIIAWDNRVTEGNAAVTFMGSSFGVKGVQVLDPQGPIMIFADGTLTVGSSGIDLSAATKDISIGQVATLVGSSQTWNPGARTLTLDIFTRGAGSVLNFQNTGGGVVHFNNGATGAAIGGYATLNLSDYAALDASNNVVAATYADYALGGNLSGTYAGILNITGTAASATQAWRNSNSLTVGAGVRFGVNNAQNTKWTVDTSSAGRLLTTPSILVGSAVTQDIEFGGSGGVRPSSTGGELILHNNGTGNLIFNTSLNGNGASSLVKAGTGKVILNGGAFQSGITRIVAGTLQVGNNTAAGSIAGAIENSGALVFARSDALTVPGVISGTGPLTQSGAGELTLSGVNTYTGATNINAGSVALSALTNFGAGTAINFGGGGLKWAGTGNTTDISARTVTLSAGTATLNTNGNNVTLASSFGGNGAGALLKTGAGTLTLSGANTYTGGTTVNAGVLTVANTGGSATGSGPVTVANGGTLTGTGSMGGVLSVALGATLTPGGSSVGTLTAGGLSLASGSSVKYDVASTSSYDRIVTTTSNGLTVNGGNISVFAAGTEAPLGTPGTYNIIQYSGSVLGAGVTALSVANPQAGYAYTFGTAGGFVTLLVEQDAIPSQWNTTGAGSWSDPSKWSNGVPAAGYTAQFTTNLGSPATITLDGNRTVNGMVFTSAQAYTIAQGSGSGALTLDKGSKTAAINVSQGSHVISAPVVFSSGVAVDTAASTGLSFTGVVSGAGLLGKSGDGLLEFTGHNTFTGAINATNGVLAFSHADSLGSGALTLNGATLRYNAGNTADISSRSITFGSDGAVVDTQANDVIWMNPVGNNGTGSFTKTGTGILAFDAANTYSGGTVIEQGTLRIASDASLGQAGTALVLAGGTLAGGTLTLPTDRLITVGAAGGGLRVESNGTFTVAGVMSGAGALTKAGTGTLILTANNSTRSGATIVEGGVVDLADNGLIGQTGLGTGLIRFTGNADFYLNGAGLPDNNTNYGNLTNALEVYPEATVNIYSPSRGDFTGGLSGKAVTVVGEGGVTTTTYVSGVVNFYTDFTRFQVSGVAPNFTGTYNIRKTPTGAGTETDEYRLNDAGHNFSAAKVHVYPGILVQQVVNPPNNTIGRIHQFGELTVDAGATLGGNTVGGRYNVYQIGALNTNSVIDGQIRGSALGSFGHGYPRIIKVGTGRLTVNNDHMISSGATSPAVEVNAGVFDIRGSIANFYLAPGADGIYGSGSGGGADDLISLTQPAGDSVVVVPGPVSVAVGATLAGNGTLGGAITVNGNLQPDVTGSIGGALKLTGAASLTLASTAVTQFDFGGTVFTGIQSTATGANAYGGDLKLNFLGSVYNGSYPLFQFATAPTGAFNKVIVTSGGNTLELGVNVGTGAWEGVVGTATLSFNPATGVLTVTGGASAVLPGVPGGVVATPGNAQVALSWNAAANATSYIVKRATVAGGPYTSLPATGVTSYTDTGLTNGTTYYYVVQGKNAAGLSSNSAEVSATPVAAPVHTALETWRFDQFGVYTDDGTVLAGDLEDYDGDGLVNLQEYAFGTNPKVANASPVVVGRNGDKLTLTYPRIADAKLTYTVQGVNDLAGSPVWATVDTKTGNVAGSTVVEDTALLSANPRRFLRLSVTYTP